MMRRQTNRQQRQQSRPPQSRPPQPQPPQPIPDARDLSGDLKVFIAHQDAHCAECREQLGHNAWIVLTDAGAICLSCADLDHLAYLPAGNATLSRRAKKYSPISAIVLKFSRSRGRYERQGLLVEEASLDKAEAECLADADARLRRREREACRRETLDAAYVEQFARAIRAKYPGCPADRERIIAEHACLKHSRRIGRSAAAKDLEEKALRLAVVAHIRHAETNYDRLLGEGQGRDDAREMVAAQVARTLDEWTQNPA